MMIKKFLIPIFCKQEPKHQIEDDMSANDYFRELEIDTLARTIFGEARGEPIKGQEAVANVIINRVKVAQAKMAEQSRSAPARLRPKSYWWGRDIISVCQKPYQFSCWNKSDPSYRRLLAVKPNNIHFATALRIARRAVLGVLEDHTGGATHYHADYVSPHWARGQKPTIVIGRHLFFKLVEV